MSSRRRIIIILCSVAAGSLISLYFIKKRMGTLSPDAYLQLAVNFLFTLAIVVGIALLFQKMNRDQEKKNKTNRKP